MRFFPLVLAASMCLFMFQSLGRTIYVNEYEFKPAVAEFNEAKARGDLDGMQKAYEKERRAHERTFDPFWLADYFNR